MNRNYKNKWIRVVSKDTGETICQGKCVSQKLNFLQLVSTDNKYFFRVENSPKYEVLETTEVTEVGFDVERFKGRLNMYPFVDAMATLRDEKDTKDNIDVFVENNERELDKEVVEIVRSLNRIKGLKTTGSCSGHYLRLPWIIMEFTSLQGISKINMIINNPMFCDHFVLSNDKKIKLIEGSYPSMTLFCKKKLPFANKYFKKLVEYIDSIT